ncbi:MAG: hypothetical protein KDA60_13805, partial [Planctomycetales bacterium]|nr:hypothetical protein [Planctomycetales bacterium]
MNTDSAWRCIEPSIAAARESLPEPLDALAAAAVPAIVIRGALSADSCEQIVRQLIDEGLLYDPQLPVADRFLASAIPEGYFREGVQPTTGVPPIDGTPDRRRIDVGTSLGYRGSDQEDFFAHSESTHRLFERLYAVGPNPIALIYDHLQALSPARRVVTAYEPDGRRYGPAIFRAHYGAYTYKPHFDSVRLREKRSNYAVYQFEHQFAGVLVLQNSRQGDRVPHTILHRCLWEPDIDRHLQNDTFADYARDHATEQVEVRLE